MYAGSFDSVGSTELQNAGKAGLVTVQGKISAVLGTVLICKAFDKFLAFFYKNLIYHHLTLGSFVAFSGAYLFITFFPDQAEKILALFPST